VTSDVTVPAGAVANHSVQHAVLVDGVTSGTTATDLGDQWKARIDRHRKRSGYDYLQQHQPDRFAGARFGIVLRSPRSTGTRASRARGAGRAKGTLAPVQ